MRRHLSPRARLDRGFTMIELLIVIMISGIVMVMVLGVITAVGSDSRATTDNLSSTSSEFQTNSRFADDVTSALSADLPWAGPITGCGAGPSVLNLIGTDLAGGTSVRSYAVISTTSGPALERRTCSGSDLAAALATTTVGRTIVVRDLARTPGSPATAGCYTVPAHQAVAPGSGCQEVDLTVRTISGLAFTVSGVLRTTPAPAPLPTLPPTTTTTTTTTTTVPPTTVPGPPQTCTVSGPNNVDNTWVDELLGHTNDNHNGDTAMNILYLAGSRRFSFLRFKLVPGVTPCEEGGVLPVGRTVTSATMRLYTFHIGGLPACGANSCVHVLERVNGPWAAPTLTWKNQPQTQIPGQTLFKDGNGALSWGARYQYISGPALLADIQSFYSGTAPNNGWAIKEACAITYGKACGDISPGFQFHTSYWGTTTQQPALTLVLS